MNMLVCIKQTFDTEEKLVVVDGQIREDGVEFIINPYDEYAVEEAIRVKEQHGGEVTVVTIGPPRAEQVLRKALAMGADKAIFLEIEENKSLDEHSFAQLLASIVQLQGVTYDLIFCGYMAIDDGSAQVGPRLAELLQLPLVSTITKLTISGQNVQIEKDMEGDVAFIQTTLPLLVTTQQGLNEPRYPTIPGIMKAKRKPLTRLTIDDLPLTIEQVRAKTETTAIFLAAQKTAGVKLLGSPEEQVAVLLDKLINVNKVL
jgi:electron transfer flavoprotein beta subunit